MALSPGRHVVYVYAINSAGGGTNPLLRQLDVQVPDQDAPPPPLIPVPLPTGTPAPTAGPDPAPVPVETPTTAPFQTPTPVVVPDESVVPVPAPRVARVASLAPVHAGSRARCAAAFRGTSRLEYSWHRNGKRLPGRVKATVLVPRRDVGARYRCVVTARNDGGTTSTSSRVVRVRPPKLIASGARLLGRVEAGRVVRVAVTWRPVPTKVRYQWLRDGKPIKGATSARYRVRGRDESATITCRINATRRGYSPTSVQAK